MDKHLHDEQPANTQHTDEKQQDRDNNQSTEQPNTEYVGEESLASASENSPEEQTTDRSAKESRASSSQHTDEQTKESTHEISSEQRGSEQTQEQHGDNTSTPESVAEQLENLQPQEHSSENINTTEAADKRGGEQPTYEMPLVVRPRLVRQLQKEQSLEKSKIASGTSANTSTSQRPPKTSQRVGEQRDVEQKRILRKTLEKEMAKLGTTKPSDLIIKAAAAVYPDLYSIAAIPKTNRSHQLGQLQNEQHQGQKETQQQQQEQKQQQQQQQQQQPQPQEEKPSATCTSEETLQKWQWLKFMKHFDKTEKHLKECQTFCRRRPLDHHANLQQLRLIKVDIDAATGQLAVFHKSLDAETMQDEAVKHLVSLSTDLLETIQEEVELYMASVLEAIRLQGTRTDKDIEYENIDVEDLSL